MSETSLSDKSPKQQLLHRELVEGLSRLLQKASDNQDAIVGGEINELTREFHLITKSGERQYVGIIAQKGEPGDNGVSILDVQLVEDPEQPGRVFFETELSNGLVLQTRNSIEGYHGKSLVDARIENNEIIFVLEGGVELDPISVNGLRPVSINGAYINEEREVILTLTDNSEIGVGLASELKGRGISEVYRESGKLFIKYDAEGDNTIVDLGALVGLKSIAMVEGEIVVSTDDDNETNLGPLIGLTRAAVEENHLVFYTNQTGDEERWDLGQVENLRGDDGLSIKTFDVSDNTIYVTLSNDESLPPVPVSGLKPISVIGARFSQEENELYLLLDNGNEITSGIGADFKGDGVEFVEFDAETGAISVKYTKEEDTVVIGNVPTITDFTIAPTGEIEIQWSHLETPMKVGDLRSIENIERADDGLIQVTFNNADVIDLGYIKSIESIDIDGDSLLVTLTGEEPVIIGSLRGDKGDPGRSLASGAVNDAGNLILTMDDGEEQDVGYVRTTIQNFLGETRTFKWSDGPDFANPHIGNVLMFVGSDVIPLEDINLDVEDTVTYLGAATYDADAVVTIVTFIMATADETGRGVFKIDPVGETLYRITLEDGSIFEIDTETEIDFSTLPPGIETAAIHPTTSMLTITKTDGEVIEVGVVNSSDNTKEVYIDDLGMLHIVLNSGLDLEAGSVVSNMTIEDVQINPDGDLLVYLKGAPEPFNAGPTANYVTDSFINENDRLIIETSDGREIDAGVVRSPLLGTIYEFTGVAGQTKFRLDHAEFRPDVFLQGIGLFEDQVDLTDPKYITLVDPLVRDGQRLKVILYSRGEFKVTGLAGTETAPVDSYYGIDADGNAGWHSRFGQMAAQPSNIAAREEGDVEVSHVNSGLIDVYKNGSLMHSGYRNNDDNTKLIFDTPLSTTDELRVVDYSRPQVKNGLLAANYGRVIYQTFSPGGTFTKGDWRVRSVNAILDNQIGVDVRNNRMILQPGTYYVRGYAACKGVGNNVLKLYNQSTQTDLLVGGAQFSSASATRAYQVPDDKTEISGYFEIDQLAAVILMHKGTITMSSYGFGSGNAGGGAPGKYEGEFDIPGRLVDLEIWKMS